MGKKRLVVIGNGMAGARLVEDVLAHGGAGIFDIVVFGDEACGSYNRICLSSVLGGTEDVEDTVIHPVSWYEQHGITFHCGVRAGWIDRVAKDDYRSSKILLGHTPSQPVQS